MANDNKQLEQLLKGFEEAYAGRQMFGLPDNLARRLVEQQVGREQRLGWLRPNSTYVERSATESTIKYVITFEQTVGPVTTA